MNKQEIEFIEKYKNKQKDLDWFFTNFEDKFNLKFKKKDVIKTDKKHFKETNEITSKKYKTFHQFIRLLKNINQIYTSNPVNIFINVIKNNAFIDKYFIYITLTHRNNLVVLKEEYKLKGILKKDPKFIHNTINYCKAPPCHHLYSIKNDNCDYNLDNVVDGQHFFRCLCCKSWLQYLFPFKYKDKYNIIGSDCIESLKYLCDLKDIDISFLINDLIEKVKKFKKDITKDNCMICKKLTKLEKDKICQKCHKKIDKEIDKYYDIFLNEYLDKEIDNYKRFKRIEKFTCYFKKYKNKLYKDVPLDYLKWLLKTHNNKDKSLKIDSKEILFYIRYRKEVIQK